MRYDGLKRMREGAKNSGAIQRKKKKARKREYNKNPKLCLKQSCRAPIPYEKRRNEYCSRSCATSCNNTGVRRHGESPVSKPCKLCNKITTNPSFCSVDCRAGHRREQVYQKIREGTWQNKTGKNGSVLREFLLKDRGNVCERCGRSEWEGQPIKVTVHHIDGNAGNNKLDNVCLLCWNCHSLTKTFGRGKHKSARNWRYGD